MWEEDNAAQTDSDELRFKTRRSRVRKFGAKKLGADDLEKRSRRGGKLVNIGRFLVFC